MIKMCIHCTCVVVSVFFNQLLGAVVVVIVWYFDLQLPVQSVPITSNVVGSNPDQARCIRLCDKVCQWLGPLWSWSYGSWIYNYLCNQCLSPLMLWVRISIRARCTTLCEKVCHWLATGRWFSPGPSISSIIKTDRHDITEILLKVALNIIKPKQNKTNQLLSMAFNY